MNEELRDLRADVKAAAEKAAEAANQAAANAGLLQSIQNQTATQWAKIEDVSRTMERTVTVLERVVKDQSRLEDRLDNKHGQNASRIADHESQISEARGGLKMFKWIAGIGGASGLAAFVKSFLMGPPQ